jgi:hypothetical protein
VQHEGLLLLAFIALQPLSVVCGAQRGRNQACVSPRVNSAEPWVRGRTLVSMVISRISSKARRSGRMRSLVTCSRKVRSRNARSSRQLLLGRRIVGGQLGSQLVLDLLDQRVAFGLAVGLGVERVLEAVADLGLQLFVVGFVELRRGEGPLGLAGQGNQLVDGGDDLLDLDVWRTRWRPE